VCQAGELSLCRWDLMAALVQLFLGSDSLGLGGAGLSSCGPGASMIETWYIGWPPSLRKQRYDFAPERSYTYYTYIFVQVMLFYKKMSSSSVKYIKQ